MRGGAPQNGQQQRASRSKAHFPFSLEKKQACGPKQAERRQHKTAANGAGHNFFNPLQQKTFDMEKTQQTKQRQQSANAGIDFPPEGDLLPVQILFCRGSGCPASAAASAGFPGFVVCRISQFHHPSFPLFYSALIVFIIAHLFQKFHTKK